jgi:Na+/H+ antiporter NhaC
MTNDKAKVMFWIVFAIAVVFIGSMTVLLGAWGAGYVNSKAEAWMPPPPKEPPTPQEAWTVVSGEAQPIVAETFERIEEYSDMLWLYSLIVAMIVILWIYLTKGPGREQIAVWRFTREQKRTVQWLEREARIAELQQEITEEDYSTRKLPEARLERIP